VKLKVSRKKVNEWWVFGKVVWRGDGCIKIVVKLGVYLVC